ncbi:MAG: copper amine oxidase N-terminal domain-containing protein [Defluviitaleaceae bacterium]|nr:copper amine oxidase N-terminal domain-containing protein [Defluviitaleaceae bacterium]
MKKLALALALIMIIISIPSSFIGAPVSANIVINNVPYFPENPLQNINDRLLLPFREISEAIGADVQWDGTTRRILTTFGNRYSIMYINRADVEFGTFVFNDDGVMQFSRTGTMNLDVSPQLIGNFTYIPLRAFVETLGASVDWNASTSTAFITAIPPTPPPTTTTPPATGNDTTPPTTPERPANFGDFSNTSFFRLMSSSAVRSMYQDRRNNPFVVVVYNSTLDSSKYIVPSIQDAAQGARFRVYGIDMANTNNRTQDNSWLWTYFREAQFVDPTLYFVHSTGQVRQTTAPSDFDALEEAFVRFRTEVETGIAFGDFTNTNYFVTRTDQFIAREINDRNEFIVVLYDSSEDESGHYVPIIKAAAAQEEILIHGLDVDRHPNFHRNIDWFSNFRDHNRLPLMILVYENRNDMRYHIQPTDVSRAVAHIDEFVANRAATSTPFPDVVGGSFFRNESIQTLNTRYNNGNEFLIFLYDSSNHNHQNMVTAFANAANVASSTRVTRVYGVNRSSTVFPENRNIGNFNWLNLSSAFLSGNPPMLIRLGGSMGPITHYPATTTAHRNEITLNAQLQEWLR